MGARFKVGAFLPKKKKNDLNVVALLSGSNHGNDFCKRDLAEVEKVQR